MAEHIHIHLRPRKARDAGGVEQLTGNDIWEEYGREALTKLDREGTLKVKNGTLRKVGRAYTRTKDAGVEEINRLKAELQRLETRMNAYTVSAPLKEKQATSERIKAVRAELKRLGVKDSHSDPRVAENLSKKAEMASSQAGRFGLRRLHEAAAKAHETAAYVWKKVNAPEASQKADYHMRESKRHYDSMN